MSWFKWRRTPPPVAPQPVDEPEPARSSLAEKIARWQAHFAAQRRAQPSVDAKEAERERARRQRQEALEDDIARSIAAKGYWLPHEDAEEISPTPRGLGGGRSWGGEHGPWFGFFRW